MDKYKCHFILFLILYIILSLIKLFTGIVYPMGGTETYLITKIYPTIKNVWVLGENYNYSNLDIGDWYFEEKYYVLSIGENGIAGEELYSLLIKLWWIITVLLITFAIKKIITKRTAVFLF